MTFNEQLPDAFKKNAAQRAEIGRKRTDMLRHDDTVQELDRRIEELEEERDERENEIVESDEYVELGKQLEALEDDGAAMVKYAKANGIELT